MHVRMPVAGDLEHHCLIWVGVRLPGFAHLFGGGIEDRIREPKADVPVVIVERPPTTRTEIRPAGHYLEPPAPGARGTAEWSSSPVWWMDQPVIGFIET